MNRALYALFAISLIFTMALSANAQLADTGNTQAAEASVTVQNAKNVDIDASDEQNVIVTVQDEDIALRVESGGVVDGYITVSYDDSFTTKAKVLIEKDHVQYFYTISSGTANLPLQMGDGLYTVIVYKHLWGIRYSKMTAITIEADGLQEESVYVNSIQVVDYKRYQDVVDKINQLLETAKSDEEEVKIIYQYIALNLKYSYKKARNMQYVTDYLPDLREFTESGEGICYDYASLFAAILRSNGIPTKLIMGYRAGTEKYHAWNEVLLGGEWVVIDTSSDAQIARAGKKTDMIKASSMFVKKKEY